MNQNKGWMPPDASYDHKAEFVVAGIINEELFKLTGIEDGHIVSRAKDRCAPDLNHYGLNFKSLEVGKVICHVEVEQKTHEKDDLHEFPRPPVRWPYWSFLDRKISNPDFADRDVYLLFPNDEYIKKCFWATFGDIRSCVLFWKYTRILGDRKEIYWRCKIENGLFIKKGYPEVAKYLVGLE